MPRCEFCGMEIYLPFQCNYCQRYFCEVHRLLENHDCSNAPPRTPLGNYRAKQMLAANAQKREVRITTQNTSNTEWKTETKTDGNIFEHRFNVPIEVYANEKYHERLDKAKTLSEVENIVHDYYKHHPKHGDYVR